MSSFWIAVVGGFVGGLTFFLAFIVLCCYVDFESSIVGRRTNRCD